jgi:hypothetical protein
VIKKIKDLTNDERQEICETAPICDGCSLNVLRANGSGHICVGALLNFIGEADMQIVLEKLNDDVEF